MYLNQSTKKCPNCDDGIMYAEYDANGRKYWRCSSCNFTRWAAN